MAIRPDEITSVLKTQLEQYRAALNVTNVGSVIQVGDGIARIFGMEKAMAGELGVPLDGKGPIQATEFRPIEFKAPGIVSRQSVCEPLMTGITAIDGMIPIGRGQRELIIGDRQTGKTAIAVDTIINQKNQPNRPICIYVAIGQKDSNVARLQKILEETGAMEYSIIVNAPATASAAMQFLAPYAGAAMGEYFMFKGQHALNVYDDLSRHAQAYRAMSLLLRRPPGREAYPGDVFYLHSRLLERASKLSEKLGGGLEAFAQFASDLDKATQDQIRRGQKLIEVLKQPQYQPLSLAQQVSIIFAANKGVLDDVESKDISKFKTEWFKYLSAQGKEVEAKLNSGSKPTEQEEKALHDQLVKFKDNFFKA